MARAPLVLLAAMLVLGCADVGTGDDTNPFGDGTTAASGQATVGPEPTSGEGSTGGSAATGTVTTGTPTTDAPTAGEASTSAPPGTSEATTAPGDSGGPGAGELGECVGIGAWESCAQYCEAVLDVCVEGGCSGATVVYYGDVADCTAMRGGSSEATACDVTFSGGGSASFARCCCQ